MAYFFAPQSNHVPNPITFMNNILRSPKRVISPSGLFGALAALVMTVASVAQARPFTPSEQQINAKLSSGTVLTASHADIYAASTAALQQTTYLAGVSPASLVATAEFYAADYAPGLAQTGLDQAQQRFTNAAQLNLQVSYIVNVSMSSALVGNTRSGFVPATKNKADRAANVTAAAVNSVKGSTNASLLVVVVRTAVGAAQNFGGTSITTNGAAGAVTGAIAQVAGSGNNDLGNGTTNQETKDDNLVKTVIYAAVVAAPRRLTLIAEAAGYAFAGTYIKTNGTDDSNTFLDNNLAPLLNAVLAGLPVRLRANGNLQQAIRDQITAGISLAYSGYAVAGSKGVSDFAYNNGQNPVTDTTGL